MKDACYWCGDPDIADRDHVFSRGLFCAPRPHLITVPACTRHNQMFSADEEYFRDFAVAGSYAASTDARRLWTTVVSRSLRRSPKYRALLAGQMSTVELRRGSLYLGDVGVMVGDGPRIDRVLEKMMRGLYYDSFREVLGDVDLAFDHRGDGATGIQSYEILRAMPLARVGHVGYRFAQASDDARACAAALRFFDSISFVVASVPRAAHRPPGVGTSLTE